MCASLTSHSCPHNRLLETLLQAPNTTTRSSAAALFQEDPIHALEEPFSLLQAEHSVDKRVKERSSISRILPYYSRTMQISGQFKKLRNDVNSLFRIILEMKD